MINNLRKYLGKTYHPLNLITISKQNLISNYKYLSSLNKNIKIAPVLKSNAYGHGIVNVAKILEPFDPPMFCVDSLYEAYELHKADIKTPILIMGYINPQNLKVKRLPFSYCVYDLKLASVINKYQKRAIIHIKVDTGMHRLGVPISEFRAFTRSLKKLPNIKIDGLISHLAAGDGESDLYKKQVSNFEIAQNILESEGININWKHFQASDGFLSDHTKKIGEIANLARVGLAIYGISNNQKYQKKLKPVLEFSTRIAQIKYLKKGDKVGYLGTYTAQKDLKLAVLPVGYQDGVDLRLSNRGYICIGRENCPIIGRVSMNITTVDISQVKKPYIGQNAIIYSREAKSENSVLKSSQTAKTMPYELLIHLDKSVKRIIV